MQITGNSVVPGGARPAVGALAVDQARYERQLADWKACPSCKTPAGKEKIAEISADLAEVKSQISKAEAAPSRVEVAQASARLADRSLSATPEAFPVFSRTGDLLAGGPSGLGQQIDFYA